MNDVLSKLVEIALNFVYPPVCLLCREIINVGERHDYFCKSCRTNVRYLEKAIYPKRGDYFDIGFSVLSYSDISETIKSYKFKSVKSYGKSIGEIMADYAIKNANINISDYDLIIPVPLHVKRFEERGFNQSEIPAAILSDRFGVPIDTKSLIRHRHTFPQSLTSLDKRNENIEKAFKVTDSSAIEGKKILIIDDVITTGSTINECALTLKNANASKVAFYTLANSGKI